MIAKQRQSLRIKLVDTPCAFAAVPHQSRLFQHPQMLRNRRAGNRQPRRQLIHRPRVIPQHLEDRQPGGIAQRGQPVLYVSIHLR